MKIAAQVLLFLGIGLLLWGGYQYFSNQPTRITEPKDLDQGIQALRDMYSNVFEKVEKQHQAKGIAALGGIMIVVGSGLVIVSRKQTNLGSTSKAVPQGRRYCDNCGTELKSGSAFCASCGMKVK